MVEQTSQLQSRKRPMISILRPEDIVHRFSSKADFIKYFEESRKSYHLATLTPL